MSLRRSRRVRTEKKDIEISLTPLIDTTLVLLVIFMVAVPAVRNSIHVELPSGERQEVTSSLKDLMVTIDAREHLFVNEIEVPIEELARAIERALPTARGKLVFLSADKSLIWDKIFSLAERIKKISDVQQVVFISQRKRISA